MKYQLVLVALLLTACGQIKGPAGANGIDGAPGQQGATGATGTTGPQGDRGPAGINATSVTMVQLCPGEPVYPTTFVEYAFCVNNELYGTYSANGGFTTLLPPGRYTSNGINSRCDFTVGAGCEVSQ